MDYQVKLDDSVVKQNKTTDNDTIKSHLHNNNVIAPLTANFNNSTTSFSSKLSNSITPSKTALDDDDDNNNNTNNSRQDERSENTKNCEDQENKHETEKRLHYCERITVSCSQSSEEKENRINDYTEQKLLKEQNEARKSKISRSSCNSRFSKKFSYSFENISRINSRRRSTVEGIGVLNTIITDCNKYLVFFNVFRMFEIL